MGLLNKLFGARWSLYVCKYDKQLEYVMHGNCALGILSDLVPYYESGKTPVYPWSLYMNFNKKNQSFKIEQSHFKSSSSYSMNMFSNELINMIESMDPGNCNNFSDPIVFINAKTKEQIEIHGSSEFNHNEFLANIELARRGIELPKKITFHTIMGEIFAQG